MKNENDCINCRPIFNGEWICDIIQKPISTKCSECGESCPNFKKE
jgi:hypothetical protein